MFARQNPSGWVDGDPLTADQINGIDINQSRAIDGTGGSAGTPYSPGSAIDIAGAGVRLSGSGPAGWVQVPTRTLVRVEPMRIIGVSSSLGISEPIPIVDAYYDETINNFNGYPIIRAPQRYTTGSFFRNEFILQITPPCNGATLKQAVITFNNTKGGLGAPDPGIQVAQFGLWAYGIQTSPSLGLVSTPLGGAGLDAGIGSQTHAQFTAMRQVTVPTFGSGHVVNTANEYYGLLCQSPYGPDISNTVGANYYSLSVTWTITTHQPA